MGSGFRRSRRKALYGELRKYLGPVLRDLAHQREASVEEGHLNLDPVHLRVSIPPQDAVSQGVGFIKGKSAIYIARTDLGRRQNFTGQQFWARGSYGSTGGRDEAAIRAYIQKQEAEDQRLDQLEMFAR